MTPTQLFTHWLPLLRRVVGMTQQGLADALTAEGHRFYNSTVAKIEKGERKVTLDEAYAIARILGFDLADMTSKNAPECVKKHLEASLSPGV